MKLRLFLILLPLVAVACSSRTTMNSTPSNPSNLATAQATFAAG